MSREERDLMHNLSNHLSIAHGHIRILLKRYEAQNPFSHEEQEQRLQKVAKALEAMHESLKKRKAEL